MLKQSDLELHNISEIPPTVLTLFGATGDLALLYLLPTLVHMDSERLLPKTFRLVCIGRRDFSKQEFLDFALKSQKSREKSRLNAGPAPSKKDWTRFARHIIYYRGNFEDPRSFAGLNKVIADRELSGKKHICYNRLYYFATSPEFFQPIAKILEHEGLLIGCTDHDRTVRVLLEKPFGTDLASAKSLNRLLLRFFDERQIYRIDHYLGKETVQNLLVARFANDFLEPIWNAKYIDHVEISALEPMGVEARGRFYDQTGATKDFVQNHLLNIMALIAMDRPKSLSPQDVRDRKVTVLKALKLCSPQALPELVVRGQYKGYDKDLGHPSRTETFVAIKALLNLPRWRNVPFYLRTGKKLHVRSKLTEISVHFKKTGNSLFAANKQVPNVLSFQIQPDERVQLRINNKIPGFGIRLHAGSLEFGYKANFNFEIPPAYERLLLDFMEGDQRLFIRSDEIEAAWKFIDSIVKKWRKLPLEIYRPGSEGPKAAARLIERDGRRWWTK
jgi:glucose-6-phosphate 1-dehydrogenase